MNEFRFEPTGISAIDRRRQMASIRLPNMTTGYQPPVTPAPPGPAAPPMQRQPAAPVAAAAPAGPPPGAGMRQGPGGGSFSSTGDALLDLIRQNAMADAAARSRGARFSAQSAAPNDPSLAAYAGLEGLLAGQGDASRSLNQGALGRLSEIDQRKWEEYMMRLNHEWQMEQQRLAAKAALYGSLGQVGGSLAGEFIP